jgi:hypothetical protein
VARAAASGRTPKTRGEVPLLWYASLAVVIVLGVTVVAYSRYEEVHPAAAVQPAVGTHWQEAYAIDVCGHVLHPLPRPSDASRHGITTDGEGVIVVAPKSAADAGRHATLGRFVASYPGLTLTGRELKVPGERLWRNGDRCDGRPGRVEVATWSSLAATTPTIVTSNPGGVRFRADDELFTIAFVPAGTTLSKPPSASRLLAVPSSTTTSAPSASTSRSSPAKSSSKKGSSPRSSSTQTTSGGAG